MKELSRLNGNWKFTWTLLTVLASLCSFIGSYGYFFVLAIFHPLAQTIALSRIPNVRYSAIWMLHSIYWLTILLITTTWTEIIIGIMLSTILGELLLRAMLKNILYFRWLLFNSLSMLILIGLGWLMFSLRISHDASQISIMIVMFTISAIISAQGIKLKESHR